MKVVKQYIRFKPQVNSTNTNYEAVLVTWNENLKNPSNGYGTPLEVTSRMFRTRRTARRWLDMCIKSVRSQNKLYPTETFFEAINEGDNGA